MKFANLNVVCDQCNKTHTEIVKHWDSKEYPGTILKSFWCQHCHEPQVIRYQFINDQPTVAQHLECSSVFMPKKPETGITIRPRQNSKH